jgi:hypothetical protein
MAFLSASLDRILQVSPVAWYRSSNGVTAYYEKATVDAPGIIAVNGRRIGRVFFPKIDLTQPYQPSETNEENRNKFRTVLAKYSVSVDHGWTCQVEARGMSLPDAFRQSPLAAARHENGHAAAQHLDQSHVALILERQQVWTIDVTAIPREPFRCLSEFSLLWWTGWFPSQINFLSLNGYQDSRVDFV